MPLPPLKASALIALLAEHVAKEGDAPVVLYTREMDHPVIRCWYDEDRNLIAVSAV